MPRMGEGLKAKKGGVLDGDVGRAAVHGWISGVGFPNVIQLAEICKRLDISADYLLFGESAVRNPKLEMARSALDELTATERRQLLQLVGDIPQTSEVRDYTVSKKKVVADTVVHDYDNSFELTVPDTKKDARRATSSTTPAQEPSERSQHTADSSKARRAR